MKKILVAILILLPAIALAGNRGAAQNEGVAILFDNSGSMHQYFSKDMLDDAKNAIMDLVFKGDYDEKKWKMVAQGTEYRQQGIKRVWKPGAYMYVHAFGELKSPGSIIPFHEYFKNSPDSGEYQNEAKSKQFIQRRLFNKIDYKDGFTVFDLPKFLCWHNVSTAIGSGGRNYFMNVFIVSDFVIDTQERNDSAYTDVGKEVRIAFINNGSGQTPLFELEHRRQGKKGHEKRKLQIRLLRIGPHFIKKQTPNDEKKSEVHGTRDQIALMSPRPGFKLSEEKNQE